MPLSALTAPIPPMIAPIGTFEGIRMRPAILFELIGEVEWRGEGETNCECSWAHANYRPTPLCNVTNSQFTLCRGKYKGLSTQICCCFE